jgi:hypothetical protein
MPKSEASAKAILHDIESQRKVVAQVAADLETCNVDRKELKDLLQKETDCLLALCDGEREPLFKNEPESEATHETP